MNSGRARSPEDIQERSPAPPTPAAACGFCARLGLFGGSAGAAPSMRVLTDRETEALSAMREVKHEVHAFKSRLRRIEKDLEPPPALRPQQESRGYYEVRDKLRHQGTIEDLYACAETLTRLKQRWAELDRERASAAEERMRLLGHNPL